MDRQKTGMALAFLAAATAAASALAWNPFQDDSSWSRRDPPPPPPNGGYGWDAHDRQPPPPRGGDWRDDRRDRHHGDRHDSHHGGGRKGYAMLGEFSAAGGAKEVSIGGNRTRVSIEFTAGTTSINSIVLRSGGQKTPITVVTRFNEGQRYDFNIGREVTGIRISCSGNGRFRVYAK